MARKLLSAIHASMATAIVACCCALSASAQGPESLDIAPLESADEDQPAPSQPPLSPAEHYIQFAEDDPLTSEPAAQRQASFQENVNEGISLDDLHQRLKKLESNQRGESQKRGESDTKKKDDGFEHHIFGRIQADGASFSQDAANKSQLGNIPNGVDFRRVRMGMQGKGYEVYFYRLEVDFVQTDAQTKTRPRVTDAYGEVRELPWLGTLRFGQYREPFSIERITSANDLTFIERGLPQAFHPARKLGIMAFDHGRNEKWYWWNGVFAQNSTDFGEQFGDAGRFAVVNRLVWLPWYDAPSGGRYLWHLGAAYTYQDVNNQLRKFSSTPEVSLQFAGTSVVPSFVSTPNLQMNNFQIAHFETSSVIGPLSFQAEYYGTFVSQTAGPQLFFHGAYAYVSYFLTGENRVYDRNQGLYVATKPYSDFFRIRGQGGGIATGPGAWEVAARVSTLNLNDRNSQGGRLTDFTFGVNWHLNFQTKWMFNYIHAFLNLHDKPSNADVFLTRMQVSW